MGCASSKLDDLPAVELCRDRCKFLDEAVTRRYALADAHNAYTQSLRSVGHALHAFLVQDFADAPPLNLPPQRKGEEAAARGHSHSNSGSHLHFHSDSDDGSLHSDHSSPLHREIGGFEYENADRRALDSFQNPFGSYPGQSHPFGLYPYPFPGGYNVSYMKKAPTPSVVHHQRPVVPETVQVNEIVDHKTTPFQAYEQGPAEYQSANSGNNSYTTPFYGYSNSAGNGGYHPPPESRPAPPPPSPPKSSGWNFLNPFESYDRFYAPYALPSSRDSNELREEEGIPDLEDDEVIVKEVLHGDQNLPGAAPPEKVENEAVTSHYQTRPSLSEEKIEYEVHVVEKKVVDGGEDRPEVSGPRGNAGSNSSEIAKEIEIQFERASDSGNEIAKMLEVGKLPYKSKHVATKMLNIVTPSLPVVSSKNPNPDPSTSTSNGPALLGFDEDIAMRSRNLSSTLQKLHLWEKKLYIEVKAEEKMRVVHDRKREKLKRLNERGAEHHKVETTRMMVRNLSTKIHMSIQVVDKISAMINRIRDDELWPQLTELIRGLSTMWKNMLECHQSQCQAIREAKTLGPVGSGKRLSDANLEATLRLEHELLNWTLRFSTWISAQKGYIRSLNNWLMKCLLYEPEDTPDGPIPFSPGRIGAPPVFIICNRWAQAMDRISENEVVGAMRVFAMSVFRLWEQDKLEMRRRMVEDKDLERKVKALEREDQRIRKQIQALDKRVVLVSGDGGALTVPVYKSDTSCDTLQASLQRVFEAMEGFAGEFVKAYEDLLQGEAFRASQ